MNDNPLQLSPFEKKVMAFYSRYGSLGIIALVTSVGVVISLATTWVVAQITLTPDQRGGNEMTLYMTVAALVPFVVAPSAMSIVTRLLVRLDLAYKRVSELSTTDPLTGSANRRGFYAAASQNLHAMRDAKRCIVGMVDLNNFKTLNDSYGHQLGDEALSVIAERLRTVVGECGTVGRLGGDEFAFYVLGSDREILSIEEGIIADCADFALDCGVNVSASIGIVSLLAGESVEDALIRADSSLYEIKRHRGSSRNVGAA